MKDGQTIGQWLKWDFEANGSLAIKDKNCGFIYRELSNGWWAKSEYDSKGNEIYHEDSNGYWVKREFDSQGNQIYGENSNGFWEKWEWDSQGNVIYFETSNGRIIDNRPKLCENKEIVIDGEKFKLVKV